MAQVLHLKTYMSISTVIQFSYMQSGTWALPGGHLDFGESFETCAMREVLEETGLQVKDDRVHFLTATNDIMPSEHKHYVTIFVACRPESEDLEPKVGRLRHVLLQVENANFLADPSIGHGAREM